MKLLSLLCTISCITSSLFADTPPPAAAKKKCPCVDCKCTPESHCGCRSGEDAPCAPNSNSPVESNEKDAPNTIRKK